MLTFTPHDTLQLEPLFTSRAKPKEVFEQANALITNAESVYSAAAKDISGTGYVAVMQAISSDGVEALGAQGFGLFNPTRSRTVSDFTFERFRTLNLHQQIIDILHRYVQHFPTLNADANVNINMLLIPADTAHAPLMMQMYGLACFGMAGNVVFRVLPTPGNIRRLQQIIARGMIQLIRARCRSDPAITLREMLFTEGLAACFVERVSEPTGLPCHVGFLPPDDWDETRTWLGQQHGMADYLDLTVNMYGHQLSLRDSQRTLPVAMQPDEYDYTEAVITPYLDSVQPAQIAACMYGDEYVVPFGHPSVGVSNLAGFEIGYRQVKAALDSGRFTLEQAMNMKPDIL